MSSRIITHIIFFIIVFFSVVKFANANVIINEVQIKPTGESFIELYNNGAEQNLTGWFIKRKTVSGTEYSLVSASRLKDKSISSNGYFLLVNEGNYIGNDTPDATWATSNNIANDNTIYLYNGTSVDPVSKVGWGSVTDCDGGCVSNPADGQSIQRISNGSWIVASPTPGAINSESGNTDEDNNGNTDDTDDTDNTTTTSKSNSGSHEAPLSPLKITTKIISPKTIVAGIPVLLNSLTTTNRGETYAVGKWFWNFGDGSVKEVGKSTPFEYMYEYPGEYSLSLSYFDSVLEITPETTDKIIVKVVPSEIFISSVGTNSDPFIEIENKSSSEIVLSNWLVTAGNHYFTIPEGTTLLPNKKIKLSPKITGFVGSDIGFVTISDPNKEISASYPSQTKKLVSKISSASTVTSYNNPATANTKSQAGSLQPESQIINLNDLGASAGETGTGIPKSALPIIGLLVVIGVGVASFLLVRQKKEVGEYVERGIRAEDMTIME